MKWISLSLLAALAVFGVSQSHSQGDEFVCATDSSAITDVGELVSTTWTLKILLVEFSDVKHNADPYYTYTDYENLFFSENIYVTPNMTSPDGEPVYGSMRDYFSIMSDGDFNLVGYVLNRDENDDGKPDWITLPGSKNDYYIGNRYIFSDAITIAAQQGLDVSTSETVKLAIIYAGNIYGGDLNPSAGGNTYLMSERFERPWGVEIPGARFAEIGINAHEFAHLLGIPDLHDNGGWDMMAGGPNLGPNHRGACPAPLNPQTRKRKGWIAFHDIADNRTFQADYDLRNPEVFQIRDASNPNYYWLVEARQFNASMTIGNTSTTDYNYYLLRPYFADPPDQGLLAWRVPSLYSWGVAIHADGKPWLGHPWISAGDQFPGSGNVKVLSPWSDSRTPPPYWYPNTKPSTNVGVEIVGEGVGYFTLDLYYSSPEDASPSRPQGLQVVFGPCSGTGLIWNRNLEPDMVGYNVYRGLYYSGSGEPTYTKLNSSLITDTTFVDSSYESDNELPQNIDLYHRYRITAVDNQSKESVKSDYVDAYFTYIIVTPVLADWNMTSVPNVVCNFTKTAVWPTAITPAYRFQCDTGYIQMDTLDNLRGYWIKFGPNPQNILYSGMKIDSTAMPVNACWNIIGSISTSLDTSEVTYSPSGIRASSFFRYNSGYVATETLEPGGGYWVKSSQVGYFILKASGGLQRGNGGPTLLDLDRFIIADANGGRQEMFVKNGEGDIELPPDPPEGAFNVRFQTGNYVQSISPTEGVRSLPVLLRTLTYPITVSWNIKPDNGVTYWLWQGTGGNRRKVAIRDSGSVTIAQRLSDVVELEAQAGEARNQPNKGVVNYAMDPNSPNPFNPSTQIRFQLPERNNVVLTVFDVLGRKVAELVNGYLEPGYHSVTWDATSVASGVYFARLTVSDDLGAVRFTKMSKLLLVK